MLHIFLCLSIFFGSRFCNATKPGDPNGNVTSPTKVLYSGSTTSSGPINYCMQRPWKTSFNREAKASQFATTICQLNYPKADSCQYWRIASIVMLDANTPQPIALLNSITNFLNKAAVNCNSKSKMQVFTPDLARDINQTVPMYSIGSNEQQKVFNSLPLTAFLQPNDDPGDVLASLIRLLENNDIYSNRVVNGEGAVVFVFVNSDCLKFCQSRRLMMNSGDTASILDQGNFIVRYLYMANDNAQLPCLQLLFTDCTKWSSALCDMNIYGNGPNITSLSNAANSAVTCAADNGGLNTTGRILIIVLPCFFIAVIIIIAMCLRYKKSVQRLRMQIFGTQLLGERAKKDQAKNLYTDLLLAVASKKDDWEIEPRDLTILHDSLLGSGAFSNVYKGTLAGRIPVLTVNPNLNLVMDSYSTGSTVVAVKKLPSHADDSNRLESFQEIEFMKQLGYHAHVVSMLGCVSNPIDPLIVVEYCAHGDLLRFIRKHKDHLLMDRDDVCPIDVDLCLRMKNLISFAWQIADGMVYLSSKNFIHRDLAARNVLITNTLVAKISDFGLCRQLSTSLYTSRGGRLPIKWMAIESLKYYEFTSSSDVWSFAILLFELFSLGESPYPAIQPTDMISHLEGGNRLPQPEKCPNEVYAIMENCWNVLPAERTTFPRLRDDLTTLLNSDDENYGYITLRNPANMPKMSPESIHRQISKQDVELQSLGRVSSVVSEFEHKYDIVPEDEGQ